MDYYAGIDVSLKESSVCVVDAKGTVRDRNCVPRLCHIDADENFCRMLHGSSSCDEDRLGLSEQPSPPQCRASHPQPQSGHTVLRKSGGRRQFRKFLKLSLSGSIWNL